MLHQLLESRPTRQRSRSAVLISLVFHAAVVATAVAATREVVRPDRPRIDVVDTLIFVAPRDPAPAPPVRPREPAPPHEIESAPTPPAPGPVVEVPTEVPIGITPPDPNAAPTGEPTIGSIAPIGEPGESTGAPAGSGPAGDAYWADEVERAAAPIGRQREPRYPDALRAQRIEGGVTIAFVVDTLGRVEPASVRAIEASHPLFEPAVKQALLLQRFRPAEWNGRKVRQLVQQQFVFRLAR